MKKRSELNITSAVKAMAESHGAYFDKSQRTWFVDDDVPGPLIAYVVKEKRKRDYFAEQVPQCEVCGSQMALRKNRTSGVVFLGCSILSCRGTRPYEDVASTLVNRGRAGGVSRERTSQFEDKDLATEIIAHAVELFGSEAAASPWLKAPKVGLRNHGNTPLEAIRTLEGCVITARLLSERFE
jgi:hypothetical protein